MHALLRVHLDLVGPARSELPGAVDTGQGLLHGEELPRVEIVAPEDLVERLPPLDHAADAQQVFHCQVFGGSCGIGPGGGGEEKKGGKQRGRYGGEDGRAESFIRRCHSLKTPMPRFGARGERAGHKKGASRRWVPARGSASLAHPGGKAPALAVP